MSKKDKLIKKLRSNSSFTFDEMELLLSYFDYYINNKGRTSGSRVSFINEETNNRINFHKPHPGNEIRKYQRKQLLEFMEKEGLI